MKTQAIVITIVLCVTAAIANAQTDPKTPKKTGNEWHAAGDAIPRSKAFANKIDSVVHLDAKQKKEVFQTYLANTKSVDEIKFGAKSENEKSALLKENKVEFNKKMKVILPADKYMLYEKIANPL